MVRPRSRGALVLVFAATLVAGACSGDGDEHAATTTSTTKAEVSKEYETDLETLASDQMEGRDNQTAGSARAQSYLVGRLAAFAEPIGGQMRRPFAQGVNILGLIPGTDLSDQYVVLGAHYDHLGHRCAGVTPTDDICNGATDNAAGVAEVLEIGRRLAREPVRRSVLLALWDAEEDGLLGSRAYVADPVVPLDATTVYLNWDNQGSNLLPSLRDLTVIVGAETGGPHLVEAVASAVKESALEPVTLSLLFGQGRSDHAVFAAAGVPTAFSTDSTGGCYHTVNDDLSAVDLSKLGREIDQGEDLARRLGDTDAPPEFTPDTPAATFADASALLDVIHRAERDIDLFPASSQTEVRPYIDGLEAIVAAGPAAFDDAAVGAMLAGAAEVVDALTKVTCDSFAR